MKIFSILMVFLPTFNMIKVFKFDPSVDGSLSHATPKTLAGNLFTTRFILCSSYLETSVDGTSFFTIYGEDGEPWLTLSNWETIDNVFRWARLGTNGKEISR